MRKALKLIQIWLLLSLSQSVWAAEIFTFEGTITNIHNDIYGYAANAGFQLGDSVTYTYLVDFNRPGLVTHTDGNQFVQINDANNTNYYADYLSGSGLNTPFATLGEHNYARDFLLEDGRLFGGIFGEHRVSVEAYGAVFSEWTVGQTAVGFDIWDIDTSDGGTFDGYVSSSLILTSRTVVPTPSPFFMMLIVGLFPMFSRRGRRFSDRYRCNNEASACSSD